MSEPRASDGLPRKPHRRGRAEARSVRPRLFMATRPTIFGLSQPRAAWLGRPGGRLQQVSGPGWAGVSRSQQAPTVEQAYVGRWVLIRSSTVRNRQRPHQCKFISQVRFPIIRAACTRTLPHPGMLAACHVDKRPTNKNQGDGGNKQSHEKAQFNISQLLLSLDRGSICRYGSPPPSSHHLWRTVTQ